MPGPDRAEEADAIHPVERDYRYALTDAQLRHGLAMTPTERLRWLDEARRFVLALRAAPRVQFRDGVPSRWTEPGTQRPEG